MKLTRTILVFIFILRAYSALPQKHIMKVDDSLKVNSEFMDVKRGSIGGYGKYEFGNYKIISVKRGVAITKTKSKFFSNISESESKQASSFVFTASDKDTVVVNISSISKKKTETSHSIAIHHGEIKREADEPETKEYLSDFTASILPVSDTVEWQLNYVSNFNRDSAGETHSTRSLSDGNTEFEIKEINESEDGKTSLLWMFHGYEFFLNGKAVAAVQTLTKQCIWLRNDLDEKTKLVLATAMAVMLFRGF